MRPRRTAHSRPVHSSVLRQLAWFRYQLRRLLSFNEKASRLAGLTPQQHQLMLGVAGYTGRGWATISELAEFLQERHNAVVGLVKRAARRGRFWKGKGWGTGGLCKCALRQKVRKVLGGS